jgi:hypothetical protein
MNAVTRRAPQLKDMRGVREFVLVYKRPLEQREFTICFKTNRSLLIEMNCRPTNNWIIALVLIVQGKVSRFYSG